MTHESISVFELAGQEAERPPALSSFAIVARTPGAKVRVAVHDRYLALSSEGWNGLDPLDNDRLFSLPVLHSTLHSSLDPAWCRFS